MRLRWTEPAVRDLTAICDYLREQAGPAVALRIARRIHGDLEALQEFPRKGRPGRLAGTREMVFPGLPYLAFYEIQDEEILLLAVRHGAQKWPPDRETN